MQKPSPRLAALSRTPRTIGTKAGLPGSNQKSPLKCRENFSQVPKDSGPETFGTNFLAYRSAGDLISPAWFGPVSAAAVRRAR